MENDFKINIYFDENGEELEQVLSSFLIRIIEQEPSNAWKILNNLKIFLNYYFY